jgi:hypothetical protein
VKQEGSPQPPAQTQREVAVIRPDYDGYPMDEASHRRRQLVAELSQDDPLGFFFPPAVTWRSAETSDDEPASTPPAIPLPTSDPDEGDGERRCPKYNLGASTNQPKSEDEQRPLSRLRDPKMKAPNSS